MNSKLRKKAKLISALGIMLLLFMIFLQPLAAQEKGEYPGEQPTAPVPGAPSTGGRR